MAALYQPVQILISDHLCTASDIAGSSSKSLHFPVNDEPNRTSGFDDNK